MAVEVWLGERGDAAKLDEGVLVEFEPKVGALFDALERFEKHEHKALLDEPGWHLGVDLGIDVSLSKRLDAVGRVSLEVFVSDYGTP